MPFYCNNVIYPLVIQELSKYNKLETVFQIKCYYPKSIQLDSEVKIENGWLTISQKQDSPLKFDHFFFPIK